ncbi:MAG: GNAT family N-acetyltransferase [Sporolactobacillus sp.]
MNGVQLVPPSRRYRQSFQDYAADYQGVLGERDYEKKYAPTLADFDQYLETTTTPRACEGRVPQSTFWLVDGENVVGVVRVRHQNVPGCGHIGYDIAPCYRRKGYGMLILSLALREAAKLGIDPARVICRVDNTASRRIIEKNGGRLIGSFFDSEEGAEVLAFHVATVRN